jgi:LemA protein
VTALIIVVLWAWAIVTYNRLVALRVSTQEGAAALDVQLKRRHDHIPNLVETVKATQVTGSDKL